MIHAIRAHLRELDDRQLMLQYIQPGLVGPIDGTQSALAPVVAAGVLAGSHAAQFVGLATAIGAGISTGPARWLSETGTRTGRGSGPIGGIFAGVMTTIGGMPHALRFPIDHVHIALVVAGIAVPIELLASSWIWTRCLVVPLRTSRPEVAVGVVVIVAIGLAPGNAWWTRIRRARAVGPRPETAGAAW
jgi:hypothetical protein